MIYIYDILLNWNAENEMYDFYDWELSDNIEHIKKIPLFLIETTTLIDICNSVFKVDRDFLARIKNLTERYRNKRIEKIGYGTVFTDGKAAVAVEFNSIGLVIHKSHLLLDEEDEVISISGKISMFELKYNVEAIIKKNPYLTRNDEIIRKFLKKEIMEAYKKKDINKLRYLYIEYFGEISDTNSVDDSYMDLINTLKTNINDRHNDIYNLLKLASSKK